MLAGSTDDVISGDIDGMLLGGLDGANPYSVVDFRMDVEHHSCNRYAAGRALSYLELVDDTIFEAY